MVKNMVKNMAKNKVLFVCQSCGATYPQWSGRCDSCASWNTLVQETAATGVGAAPASLARPRGQPTPVTSLAGEITVTPRQVTGVGEFDRVLGGGLVPGSVLLLGGDPGIGKSTLLLQVSATLAGLGERVTYVSGEESTAQVQLRAERLGLRRADVQLACETNVENILATLQAGVSSSLVIIDSIQTLWTREAPAAPGTVTQVRLAAQALIAHAKATDCAVILIGHVTKDGAIAGPRVVEHMVDAVLSFEGDGEHAFRLLRALKNRFGPSDEIGVFEMRGAGLFAVTNPSELFLGERATGSPGAAVFAGLEGSRPVLVEIQTLVSPSPLATPRRAVVGWDSNRLAMIIAVLETHCGVRFAARDIYLNVAGGYRIKEPAADVAVAAALVSSLAGATLAGQVAYFGEVSLSGAVRGVPQPALRLREAEKLGFDKVVMPTAQEGAADEVAISCEGFALLRDLVAPIVAKGADNLGHTSGKADETLAQLQRFTD